MRDIKSGEKKGLDTTFENDYICINKTTMDKITALKNIRSSKTKEERKGIFHQYMESQAKVREQQVKNDISRLVKKGVLIDLDNDERYDEMMEKIAKNGN